MASENAFKRTLNQIGEKLQEQEWFQQLKAKWEELDPTSRLYVKIAAASSGILAVFILVLIAIFQVRGLKSELMAKTQLRMTIQNGIEEIQRLRSSGRNVPADAGAGAGNWQASLKSAAENAGFDESSLEIGPEKAAPSGTSAKETLVTVKIKKINVKQLVRYALQLETGSTPVKLKQLSIEALDPEGYLNASLSLSIFELKKER